MLGRRFIARILIAAMFFWAPSAIPVRAAIAPCGAIITFNWTTADTAFALPAPVAPCPAPPAAAHPWGLLAIGLGAFSVIINGIVISQTQCRELTSQEAAASIFLPFVGMAFNGKHNKCH
jgi:hypothetical protein